MKNNIFKIFTLLSVLICFFGCGSGGDEPIPPEPKPESKPEVIEPEINLPSQITTNGVTFSKSQAGTQSVTFTCDQDWTLSLTESRTGTSWCTPSATSGTKGNITITFTVTENTTYDDRSVIATITAGSVSVSFTISQKGKEALFLTKEKYELDYHENTIEIEVNANVDYQMIIAESTKVWIAEKNNRGLSSKKHFFIIKKNEGTEKRIGEIHFMSKEKTVTAQIYQTCNASIIETGSNITKWDSENSSTENATEE